jgi:hypothetical protein
MFSKNIINKIRFNRTYSTINSLPVNELVVIKINSIVSILEKYRENNEYGYKSYITKHELTKDIGKIYDELNKITNVTKDINVYK